MNITKKEIHFVEDMSILMILRHAKIPVTAAELGTVVELPKHVVSNHLGGMLSKAQVEQHDRRKCKASDNKCLTWSITPNGEKVVTDYLDSASNV